jgi:hypothetical protein
VDREHIAQLIPFEHGSTIADARGRVTRRRLPAGLASL